MKALLKLLEKGRKDEVLQAGKIDRRWGRDKEQRVTIRGIRLYGRKNGPLHAQVFTGSQWVSVITVPWVVDETEVSITARAIKHRLRKSKAIRKA